MAVVLEVDDQLGERLAELLDDGRPEHRHRRDDDEQLVGVAARPLGELLVEVVDQVGRLERQVADVAVRARVEHDDAVVLRLDA